MAFDVVVTSSATRRLKDTINYLRFVCCNYGYAKSLFNEVEVAKRELEAKNGFHIVDHTISDFVGETVYRIKLGRYKLVYRIDEVNSHYVVFLFIHESQPLDVSVMRDFESAN